MEHAYLNTTQHINNAVGIYSDTSTCITMYKHECGGFIWYRSQLDFGVSKNMLFVHYTTNSTRVDRMLTAVPNVGFGEVT